MIINTTLGPLDETLLQKREGGIDNENECTTWVEYCLKDCTGDAHQTGVADAESHFCSQHVHRSAHIALKKGVFGESGIGSF